VNKTLFITFEGLEGTGKSSQIQHVTDHFGQQGLKILRTREPGGTIIAEKIRDLFLYQQEEQLSAQAELLLVLAARAQHVQELIKKNMGKVDLILCDRFTDSTIAYQGGGRNMDIAWLKHMNEYATQGLVPDITFLMDLVVSDSQNRIAQRQKRNQKSHIDRFETETINFHERIRNTYLTLAREEPNRFVVINALEKPKEILGKIIQEIEKRMK
jgi:dTMP kinase